MALTLMKQAGEHASYFSGLAPQDLAGTVLQWLARNNADAAPHPPSPLAIDIDNHDKSPKPATVLTDKPSPSSQIYCYWATHPKMNTEVGYRVDRSMYTTGKKGYLLFGPRVGLPKGQYVATLFGVVSEADGLDGCYI